MEYLKRRTEGKTVIMVTHDITEADALCQQIIHLEEYQDDSI
jgi:ABC-type nitrate/sulfonate/bicarbonate transport system ATPase subunit